MGGDTIGKQFARFDPVRARREESPGDRHPVVDVSWRDASTYCLWLSRRSGLDVRLPSRAMWRETQNRVCRGGSWNVGTSYCGSATRNRSQQTAGVDNLGFRLAFTSPRGGIVAR